MPVRFLVALATLCVCFDVRYAHAQTPGDDERSTLTLHYSLKSSALLSRAPDDPALFPDRNSATGLWRFRLEPTVHLSDHATFDLAFEQRLRAFSSSSTFTGASVLPSTAAAPFRIRRLDWQFASSSKTEWRGEIDRATVRTQLSTVDLTIGRQAIGWGRGVLFSAIDLFAPFTPLEADREWRRGVDAVRADVKVAERAAVDAIAALGDTVDRSTAAARFRGYAGNADVEIVGGRRARDLFGGAASSAAVGNAEVHGELAVFRNRW